MIKQGISEAVDVMEMIAFVTLFLGVALLFYLAWKVVQSSLEYQEQQALLREAQTIFDRVRSVQVPDLEGDSLLRSIFGQDLSLAETSDEDWVFRSVFNIRLTPYCPE